MDVKYLTYILTIAEKKNMTKAAEELYVSQSSLSQYLSRLERELGTPLFFRTKGELTLTPAGELYTEAARKVVTIQKDLYQNIAGLDRRGRITVGVTSNFGLDMLSEIIPRFKDIYPEVSIEISEMGYPALKGLLLEEGIDLGIAAAVTASPFEGQSDLLREEEVLFAVPKSHPYARENPSDTLTPEELAAAFSGENFLLSKKASSLRALADRLFDSCGFTPSAFCETNSIPATRSMIARGAGVALIAESCSVDRDSIRYYHLSPALRRLNMVIHRRNWVQNEPERTFYRLLTEYFSEHTKSPCLAEKGAIPALCSE